MGFLGPAMPWIIKGASILGGYLGGKKAQSSAMQRSPEEQAALTGATGAANTLNQTGSVLTGTGLPAVNKSLSYYQTLLSGSRPAMALATAGPRAAITDTYAGAQRNLDRAGVQGASRMEAEADLGRQRAAQIAGLTTGVQPAAAGALMQGGQGLIGEGNAASQAGAGIWQNLLGQGYQNRVYGRGEGEKAGTGIGSLLFDVLSGFGKKGGRAPMGQGWGVLQ